MKQANLRTVLGAASLIMIFFMISRLLGILRDIVIANQFGASRPYEAFLVAFGIPDSIFYVISGGALGSAFIPVFSGHLIDQNELAAWRLASAILNWLLIVLTIIALIVAVFAPQLVHFLIAPGFSATDQALAVLLMRWLLISTVIFGVSGLLMGILQAHQHFLMPALAPVVYNLAIISGAWFLGPSLGIQGLVIGVVAGALVHLLVQVPALRAYKPQYQRVLTPQDPSVREVARLMAPRMLGIAAIQFNFIWDKTLASWLAAGSLASLNWGWRVMLLPQGIIAQSVAAASFPTFSALVAQKDWEGLQDIFSTTLRGVLYLTVPAATGLLLLGRPLIQLFLERGEFDPMATNFTVWALGFYSLGLIGHSIVEIVTRVFYALHNTKVPVLAGLVAMIANMGLSWLLIHGFGRVGLLAHGGIALASSIAITGEMIWLLLALRKLPGALSVADLGDPLWRILLASGVMGLGIMGILIMAQNWPAWLLLFVSTIIGSIIYGFITLRIGLAEPQMLMARLLRYLWR